MVRVECGHAAKVHRWHRTERLESTHTEVRGGWPSADCLLGYISAPVLAIVDLLVGIFGVVYQRGDCFYGIGDAQEMDETDISLSDDLNCVNAPKSAQIFA